jgi:branched-subunit amino acid aminotransferase/4-amino-4-deoxychorismate lyase
MPSLITYVSRNGELVPAAEARISVFNPAIYGAWGVYESMQVANGTLFEPLAHLRRLAHSAEIIDLTLPASLNTIKTWMQVVIKAYGQPDCTVRLFVLGPDNGGDPVAFIWAQPPNGYPAAYYTAGATAITFEARRFLPEAKSLNGLASFMAQRRARAADVHEALLYHAGCLTEGSNSNLFAVAGGRVLTPPHTEVLSGVTRDIVIRLARENGIPLEEVELPVAEIGAWQECFITSTSRHVMPVTTIDEQPVGSRRVGPMTQRLHDLFETYFVSQVGPRPSTTLS